MSDRPPADDPSASGQSDRDDEDLDSSVTPAPVSRQWAREQRQGGTRRKGAQASRASASGDERRTSSERRTLPPPAEPSPADLDRSVTAERSDSTSTDGAAAESAAAVSSNAAAARPRLSRRGTVVFSMATLVFIAGLASLVWTAYSTSLDIKGGASIGAETNPTRPGYEAQVKANSTYLVAGVDSKGTLTDAMLVVPGATTGGTVMFIPGVTLIEDAKLELSTFAAQNGLEAAVKEIEKILGCAVSNTITADAAQLETWFTPLGSLKIDNPDTMVERTSPTDSRIVFGPGALTLEPADIGKYLSFVSDGEPGINRVTRLQTVMDAWMKAIVAMPAGAPAPGDVGSGVGGEPLDAGSMFTQLAGGTVAFQTLPTQAIAIPGTNGARVYKPDPAAMKQLLSSVVPYPTSAFPGQRPRVRVFNGSTDLGAATRAAPGIIDLGAEITVFGNWKEPTIAITDVQYNAASAQVVAEAIAAKFGVQAVGSGSTSDAYDITLVLGADVTK